MTPSLECETTIPHPYTSVLCDHVRYDAIKTDSTADYRKEEDGWSGDNLYRS